MVENVDEVDEVEWGSVMTLTFESRYRTEPFVRSGMTTSYVIVTVFR
jgi:hypothetical protein